MKKLNNKAQQEIVGFILIILIVVIIGIIFLGIYLRKDKPIVKDDAEISNFLIASGRYTSECYKDNEPNYRSLEDLAVDCYQGNTKITCPVGNSCSVLNSTYSFFIQKLWPSGNDRPIKQTTLTLFYEQNSSATKSKFLVINKGNSSMCTTFKSGSNLISLDEGHIVAQLEICK